MSKPTILNAVTIPGSTWSALGEIDLHRLLTSAGAAIRVNDRISFVAADKLCVTINDRDEYSFSFAEVEAATRSQ